MYGTFLRSPSSSYESVYLVPFNILRPYSMLVHIATPLHRPRQHRTPRVRVHYDTDEEHAEQAHYLLSARDVGGGTVRPPRSRCLRPSASRTVCRRRAAQPPLHTFPSNLHTRYLLHAPLPHAFTSEENIPFVSTSAEHNPLETR